MSLYESSTAANMHVIAPVYDTLLEPNSYELGKGDQLLPNVAYDWYTDLGGTTWTFLLRKGVMYHDNVEFTCDDAKFMIDVIRNGRDSTGSQLTISPRGLALSRVKDVQCPDKYTMKVVTNGPLPSLAATLSLTNFSLLPKHVFQGNLPLMKKQAGPGIGPFKFVQHTPTEKLTLERNPNYWNQPYPYLDRSEVAFLGSATAVTAAYRVGRADDMQQAISLTPSVKDEMVKSGILEYQGVQARHGFSTLDVNWQRKPWGDVRFTEALRCVVDSAQVVTLEKNGWAYESPDLPLASLPGGSQWALTKEEWKAVSPCHGPTAETDMAKRIQRAQDLIKQLGFGPDNTAKPNMVITASSAAARLGWLLPTLKQAYIEPKVDQVPDARTRAGVGDFDVWTMTFATPRYDPDQWYYELIYSTSDRNYGKYSNPVMDATIDAMSRELDPVKRAAMVKDISRTWLKDNARIVLFQDSVPSANVVWVHDSYNTGFVSGLNKFRLTRTWIDRDQRKKLSGRDE